MGRGLYGEVPEFADAFDEMCARSTRTLAGPCMTWCSARRARTSLHETLWTQPALFAVEVALFRTLDRLGSAS